MIAWTLPDTALREKVSADGEIPICIIFFHLAFKKAVFLTQKEVKGKSLGLLPCISQMGNVKLVLREGR